MISPAEIAIFFGLMLFSAFFSGLETGITSASVLKVRAEAEKGDRRYGYLARLLSGKESLVGMCVIGNNLMIVSIAILLAGLATSAAGKVVLTVVETIIIVIFAEIIPKAIFRKFPEKLLHVSVYPIYVLHALFWPLSFAVTKLSFAALRIIGVQGEPSAMAVSRTDLTQLAELMDTGFEHGNESSESDKVQAVLDLRETPAVDVMTSRSDIKMVPASTSLADIVAHYAENHYTKIPLFEENQDDITGYVNINDLIAARKTDSVDKFKKQAVFVPETKTVNELMTAIQTGDEVLFVVNEFNVLVGMITKEDLVEEIVGDVYSGERSEKEPVRQRKDGTFEIDCKITLEDINEQLGLSLESETERTLAGFLLEKFTHFPPQGTGLRAYLENQLRQDHPEFDDQQITALVKRVPDFVITKSTDRAILRAVYRPD